MERNNVLRIGRKVEINLWKYFPWIILCFVLILQPFFLLTTYKVDLQGKDASRLQHDINTMTSESHPVHDMWIEYGRFMNGSSYISKGSWNEAMFETFILLFPWQQQIALYFNSYSEIVLIIIGLELKHVNKLFGHTAEWRFFMYFAAVVVYSVLLSTALDGTFTTIYTTIKFCINQLAMIKYVYICKDTLGVDRFTIFTDHFTPTIKEEEEVEFEYPVSLSIDPQEYGSVPRFDCFSYCSKSDLNLCWFIETLNENYVYIFHTYDVFCAVAFIALFLFTSSVNKWSSTLIAKPLKQLCFLPYSSYVGPFPTSEGPPLYLDCNQVALPKYKYDLYLSYSEEDEYDSEVANKVKELLLDEQMTVFDPKEDILPGRPLYYKIGKAIEKSARFVVIASKTYTGDGWKKVEFGGIQKTVFDRDTELKDRLFILKVDDCLIYPLHHVTCIHEPKHASPLNVDSILRFLRWMDVPIRSSVVEQFASINLMSQLVMAGFSWQSLHFIIILVYLATTSRIFDMQPKSQNETEINEEYLYNNSVKSVHNYTSVFGNNVTNI